MSKKIKVPYEYESQFFGNRRKFRWFEVSVADHVKGKNFIAEFEPHSATLTQLLLAEKACARLWIKGWLQEPAPLTPRETMGLLTVLDMGVPEFVAAHGGDQGKLRETIKHGETLPEEESVLLVTVAHEKLEQENG